MVRRFSLIVTHIPGYYERRDALEQLRDILGFVEYVGGYHNVLLLWVPRPLEAVELLRRKLPDWTPILRAIPVLDVVPPRVSAVRESVHRLLSKAPPGSFAVRVDGYLVDEDGRLMHRVDAARYIAEGVERPVNLGSPDVLVYIKVVGRPGRRSAAVYVGPPRGILSVPRERGS
ncbi:MAG: THUMP domain-containing protein [Desulfurococcales archaeon]|nr:THUMP domain-containing protein [Desulfurococcales archaeon]